MTLRHPVCRERKIRRFMYIYHLFFIIVESFVMLMHLVERGRRKPFVRDKGLAYTQKGGNIHIHVCIHVIKKPIFTNLKKKNRAHRASSKATRPFLTKQ